MADLAFVVARPTQIETPFFRYINTQNPDYLNVYFYENVNETFIDTEIGENISRTWGIDLINGYRWQLVKNKYFNNARSVLQNNKYIIVNGYTHSLLIYILLLGKLRGKKVGLRLDSVLWNQSGFIKNIYKHILLRILDKMVDVFWVTGTKSAEYVIKYGISPDKIKTCSYIIDNDWFSSTFFWSLSDRTELKKNLNIPSDYYVITCVTKLNERESPIDLINAFHKLNLDKTILLVVGDGNERDRFEFFVKEELKNTFIRFVGYVKYTSLPLYYYISNLYVHTSVNEPWGVSVQEAMACGLPVIASEFVGSAYDLIKPGENGYIYKSGDIEDLCDKIKAAKDFSPATTGQTNKSLLEKWSYKSTWQEVEIHLNTV